MISMIPVWFNLKESRSADANNSNESRFDQIKMTVFINATLSGGLRQHGKGKKYYGIR